jgi:FtsP/CotA-like multicopper oxidase with cupredoxin domain
MNRRSFLASTGVLLADRLAASAAPGWPFREKAREHYALRIEPCRLEIAPGVVVDTLAYNGQVPGPILRMRENVPVTVDVTNHTANADIVHWHGLAIDSRNDGAMEDGSPMILVGDTLRYHFTHCPAGTRWYRMIFRNGSGDQHPIHLHRHTFEVTRAGTKEFSDLPKDVVNVMPLDSVAVDFVADNPGDTLWYCHQALHMDFGFMQLLKYVG